MSTEAPGDVLLRTVGRRISEIRRSTGLTQEQAAERLGISARAYRYIESGRENLTLLTMLGVAAVLGVEVADLLVPPASSEAKRGRPRKRASEVPGAAGPEVEPGVTEGRHRKGKRPKGSRS